MAKFFEPNLRFNSILGLCLNGKLYIGDRHKISPRVNLAHRVQKALNMIMIQLSDDELDNELRAFMKKNGISSEGNAWVATSIRDELKKSLQEFFFGLLSEKYEKDDIDIGVSVPRVRLRLSKMHDVKDTKDNKYWLETTEGGR